jgi:hypothetical protein
VPAVVPAATVIVPLLLNEIDPAAGVGDRVPAVSVTVLDVGAMPLSKSFANTEAVVPPADPLTGEAEKSSLAALIEPALTTTVAVAEAQFDPFSCSQIV